MGCGCDDDEGSTNPLHNEYYMGPADGWQPTYLTEEETGRCVFCRQTGRTAYYTRLGDKVCTGCDTNRRSH